MPTMDYEGQVERNMEHFATADIHRSNKERLAAYHRDMVLRDISPAQQQKVTAHLRIIVDHIGTTSFEDLEKTDIEDLVAWLYTRGTSKATVADYKQIIKQFWKWLNDGEDPPETAWIHRGPNYSRRILPQSLLTAVDVQAMLDSCTNNRDRALIAVLWETGARIGELIDLTIGDIELSQHGGHVIVSGKTGSRRLLLVESRPSIETWLAEHPNLRSDAYLWCKVDTVQGDVSEQISYQYIRLKILECAREKAAIDKPVNPHHFRHSRATVLANHLTEAQMCEWFGWVRGSSVPGRYVHLSGRDIDHAYRSMLDDSAYETVT
ncbi:integrase [Halosimplex carlsbadense 2-9-1]|uniref:Integrase n=1 Tax=Halosimplex carlsbadense 2-9-1 TaxID=797114 RepID=M0CC37_9EURY|nr:tyrosine-type recombinase/integrase [Halosimplex carlsbadense]ELZ20851.1 integrase [Halosimplex carlsbadense 2-9-1]